MSKDFESEIYESLPNDADDPREALAALEYCIDVMAADPDHNVKDVLVEGTDRLTRGDVVVAMVIARHVIEATLVSGAQVDNQTL